MLSLYHKRFLENPRAFAKPSEKPQEFGKTYQNSRVFANAIGFTKPWGFHENPLIT